MSKLRSYYVELDKPKSKGYEERIKRKDNELKAEEAKQDPPVVRPTQNSQQYLAFVESHNRNEAIALGLSIMCLAETRQRVIQLQRKSRTCVSDCCWFLLTWDAGKESLKGAVKCSKEVTKLTKKISSKAQR
jgi:hypothetical protein